MIQAIFNEMLFTLIDCCILINVEAFRILINIRFLMAAGELLRVL